MRINQFVAAASGLSRRAADQAIKDGRIRYADRAAVLGETVKPGETSLFLDKKPLMLPDQYTYVLLNKPTGYVSSRIRQGSDPTLYELIPEHFHTLRIAGRLDKDSSGLVLLTNDGPYIQTLTHPSIGKDKYYELLLDHSVKSADVKNLEIGVMLEDGLSQLEVNLVEGRTLGVTIAEGRNRQLRRTMGALGYGVELLHRLRLGKYDIGDLPSGAWKEVSK